MEWISVKYQMPENNAHVLVYYDGVISSAIYLYGWNMDNDCCAHERDAIVTYWMPLPDPPSKIE